MAVLVRQNYYLGNAARNLINLATLARRGAERSAPTV